jgi:putative Holliday junction resolvase
MGIDYGDRRIGIAVSDINWQIASPLKVLESHGVFKNLLKLIDEYLVKIVVVGIPITLTGHNSGKQYEKVTKFITKLSELRHDIIIITWDERLSTVAAERILSEYNQSRAFSRRNVDRVAASFILQGVLDMVNKRSPI